MFRVGDWVALAMMFGSACALVHAGCSPGRCQRSDATAETQEQKWDVAATYNARHVSNSIYACSLLVTAKASLVVPDVYPCILLLRGVSMLSWWRLAFRDVKAS